MDTILLAITVVSLAAALIMSAVAWRLSRDARARSAARIAALAAAADADEAWQLPRVVRTADATVPMAAPIHAAPATAPWAPARASASMNDAFLGSSLTAPSNKGQRGLAIAAGILLVTIVGGGYFTVFGGDTQSADVAAATEVPLELVSLRHERQNAGLAITGLVRNPVSGEAVEKLTAVVFLFDQQGALVKSSRADVDFTRLAPGDESPFVITVDAPSTVARYRVSFRNEAGIVPHIDRRGQEPIARETP
jgi:hypothetical protein